MTFIIGQNPPNRQRKGQETREVFHGTRSGDLIESIVEGKNGLFLTNICMDQDMTKINITDGLGRLMHNMTKYQPSKVIVLGGFAHKYFKKYLTKHVAENAEVHYICHPSYVLRFNRDVPGYIKTFKHLLFSKNSTAMTETQSQVGAQEAASTTNTETADQSAASTTPATTEKAKKEPKVKEPKPNPFADKKKDELIQLCKDRGIYEKDMKVETMKELLPLSLSAHIRRMTDAGKTTKEIDEALKLKAGHTSIILSRDRRKAGLPPLERVKKEKVVKEPKPKKEKVVKEKVEKPAKEKKEKVKKATGVSDAASKTRPNPADEQPTLKQGDKRTPVQPLD